MTLSIADLCAYVDAAFFEAAHVRCGRHHGFDSTRAARCFAPHQHFCNDSCAPSHIHTSVALSSNSVASTIRVVPIPGTCPQFGMMLIPASRACLSNCCCCFAISRLPPRSHKCVFVLTAARVIGRL